MWPSAWVPPKTSGAPPTRRNPMPKRPNPPVRGGFMGLAPLVVVPVIIGLAMVLSASSVHDLRVFHSAWYSFIRQVVYVVAGGGAMAVAVKVDYRRWRRFAVPLLAGSLLLLFMVLVPGVGVQVNGSSR